MNYSLPIEVLELFKIFDKNGFQLFIVGGVVRDLLLGREITDWDFTTDATPEEILKLLPEGFSNNKFGTVGLNTSVGILEITTMRKEGEYSDNRHPNEVSWTKKIEEDLRRRDFTINAMALELKKNKFVIIDNFNGKKDLNDKLIRAVGNPDKRFKEDALRLMRAIRFATQLAFDIEEKTFEAIKETAPLLDKISWERKRDELLKILGSNDPYQGLVLLKDTILLKYLLPEIDKCFGIVQAGPKHDRVYDIGDHSFLSLKFCPSPDPIVRFATLIHDVGKVDTYKIDKTGNVTFYGHEVVGAKIAKRICERFKFSKKDTDRIISLVRWHMFTVSEYQTDSAIRRFIKNIGYDNVSDMMAVRVGDRLGGGTQTETSWRMEEFKKRIEEVMIKPFAVTDLKINGADVMQILNIPPSRKVGEILQKLFEEVLEDSGKNNRDYLMSQLEKYQD